MDYYRAMQLADMIDAGLVLPTQYINWADNIILSTDEPDYIILELCIERSPEKAKNILWSALAKMDTPQNSSEGYYSWEQENYYVAFLFLKTKYQNLSIDDFLQEAGLYSDGMNTQWDAEKFFALMRIKDNSIKRDTFLNEWSAYIDQAERIFTSFNFE